MSTTRRIAFGAAAQWISRGMSIVLGLVLMPVLLGNLSKEEVGLWLLLGQSWAVLGILDLGFGAVLTRRIALAKGKSGGAPDAQLTQESLAEIADLIATGRRIYRFMAAGVFLVAWGLGFFYLRNLELQTTSHSVVWMAWTILCVCQALTVWSSIWLAVLQGMGHVGWDALLATLLSGLTLLAQIVAVICGSGVGGLAAIAAVGAIVQRVVIRRFSVRRSPELFNFKGSWNPAVLKGVPGLAVRAWLSSLGTVLVFNTDGFFIASAEGAGNIPAYRGAYLAIINVHILASVFAQSSTVFISQLWQAGQQDEVRRIVMRNLRLGLCFMLCGGAGIFFAGESLFNVWLGQGNYVGPFTVAVLVLVFLLEQQSFIISSSSRATDHEPFAVLMMTGGLLKLALALPMIRSLGVLGLALSTLVAQLLTAHWFVAWQGLKRLAIPLKDYLRLVLLPAAAVLAIVSCACYAAQIVASTRPDWVILLAVVAASGLVLGGAFWVLVLTPPQRSRLLSRLASCCHLSWRGSAV